MLFTKRESLTIVEVYDEKQELSFVELKLLLMKRPSNMIYCVRNNKLCGIISMGDIHRAVEAGEERVPINRQFTFLHEEEVMHAKNLFCGNEKINSIPIVNSDGEFIGDYSRWDDIVDRFDFESIKSNPYSHYYLDKYKIIGLVKPCGIFANKLALMSKWKAFFDEYGILTEYIESSEVSESFSRYDIILFVDEDEFRGVGTLYYDILRVEYNWRKTKTLMAFGNAISENISVSIGEKQGEILGEEILEKLVEKGVYCYTLQLNGTGNDRWAQLDEGIDRRFKNAGRERTSIMPETFYEEFYGKFYTPEYAKTVSTIPFYIEKNGFSTQLKDVKSEFYNVIDGNRYTINQPERYEKTIYFFGPCMIVGQFVEDSHTIESFLQTKLNIEGYEIRVVNSGCWADRLSLYQRVCSTNLSVGDIVIIYDHNMNFSGIPNINLVDSLINNDVKASMCVDMFEHGNYIVYNIFANQIYESILDVLVTNNTCDMTKVLDVNIPYEILVSKYIDRYFYNFSKDGVIGAIVMNCNPFTYGHRYLIETALSYVDKLIIFVVEENKSVFTYKERLAMVIDGTKDLDNIYVVPSGFYILSNQTFPEYFLKIEDSDIKKNVEFDITLFAEMIAPQLNITYRFVGEEPFDTVTNEYNNAMKKILPKYGIKLIEVPRKTVRENNIELISATLTRKCLEHLDKRTLAFLVPQSTIEDILPEW